MLRGTYKAKAFFLLMAVATLALAVPASAATLLVGPTRTYKTPCAAIAVAAAGDTIQIDPVLYQNDTCAWGTNNLTIEGVLGPNGERPDIDDSGLTGAHRQGHLALYKGIFVPQGSNTVIKNIEFSHASIPKNKGNNGAGIRQDGTNLTVLNCKFDHDQDGILESNVAGSAILIKYSEFAFNGAGDGQSHNLYIGHAGSLDFEFNYSHDASVGHLLKTRAAVNYILYNRLTGENGTDSYECDIPNGGTSYVIGNLIQQGPNTQNRTIVTYLEEGPNASNPATDLYVVNNSIVNQDIAGGTFVFDASTTTPALLQNNIFDGPGTITNQANAIFMTNFTGDPSFVDVNNFDYHLNSGSPAIDAGSQPGSANGFSLTPQDQYVHPTCGQVRTTVNIIDIGAYEFNGGGAMLQCH